jgi:nuclear pore complex protein Nup155
MWRRASSVEEKIPLKERVECMTRATNSFQTAKSKSTKSTAAAAAAGVFLGGLQNGLAQVRQPSLEELNRVKTQVDEQLDIATLQSKLLGAIMASNLVADIDSTKMDALETSLVPVSDMYNEYAGPLALYDVCLLILRTCHENDTNSIIKLWKSIFCDYTIPCRASTVSAQTFLTDLKRGSMLEEEDVVLDANAGGAHSNLPLYEDGDWIPKLKNRVISLGKDLYGQGADYTFPLDLIVKTLEGEGCAACSLYVPSYLPVHRCHYCHDSHGSFVRHLFLPSHTRATSSLQFVHTTRQHSNFLADASSHRSWHPISCHLGSLRFIDSSGISFGT